MNISRWTTIDSGYGVSAELTLLSMLLYRMRRWSNLRCCSNINVRVGLLLGPWFYRVAEVSV